MNIQDKIAESAREILNIEHKLDMGDPTIRVRVENIKKALVEGGYELPEFVSGCAR